MYTHIYILIVGYGWYKSKTRKYGGKEGEKGQKNGAEIVKLLALNRNTSSQQNGCWSIVYLYDIVDADVMKKNFEKKKV